MIKVKWNQFTGLLSLLVGIALSFYSDWAYFFYIITAICLIMGLNYEEKR